MIEYKIFVVFEKRKICIYDLGVYFDGRILV